MTGRHRVGDRRVQRCFCLIQSCHSPISGQRHYGFIGEIGQAPSIDRRCRRRVPLFAAWATAQKLGQTTRTTLHPPLIQTAIQYNKSTHKTPIQYKNKPKCGSKGSSPTPILEPACSAATSLGRKSSIILQEMRDDEVVLIAALLVL